jgi:Na+-translocating ferredoxin:NAD+ oxidoreductase subunit A
MIGEADVPERRIRQREERGVTYVGIIITFILIQNFVLTYFLGLCPLIDLSRRMDTAFGLGLTMTFVMAVAAVVTWVVDHLVLMPLGITFLRTLAFILVIVGLVQLLDLAVRRLSAPLHGVIGRYLPLVTANSAVLGIALIVSQSGFNVLQTFVAGVGAGLGFLLIMLIMAGLRERLDLEWVPRPLRGVPIAFVSAGLMAMAFLAFDRSLLHNLLG